MTPALVLGMITAVGCWWAWSGLRPEPETLSEAMARLDREPAAREDDDPEADRDVRWGRLLLRRVSPLARMVERLATDLRIVRRSPEEQALRMGAYTLIPFVVGPSSLLVMTSLTGMPVPPIVPLIVMVGGALAGPIVQVRSLRKKAAARRRAFCHALSAWCDVVVMSLAAGRGVEQAVETAATAGDGWVFVELRAGLRAGHVRGETPWVALGGLGADLGVKDLEELGTTIGLAGEEGATVRDTVSAKAETIRERMTAEAEMDAASATEKMSLPSVALVMGFLIFLVAPSAMRLMFNIGS